MRNIKHLIVYFIVIISTKVFAQDFWTTLPFPDTVNVSAIASNIDGGLFAITRTVLASDGIYSSFDGGLSWQLVYPFFQTAGGNSISINNEGNVYVLTNHFFNNLLISHDNGLTWDCRTVQSMFGSANTVKATGGDTLFVGIWGWGTQVLRSVDEGLSWDTVYQTQGNDDENFTDIVIRPDGKICISLMAFGDDTGGVYCSSDNGENWELLTLRTHQITDLELDSLNNLIITDRSNTETGIGGIYYYDFSNEVTDTLLYGDRICGILNVSQNNLYAGASHGILYSADYKYYEYINTGLEIITQMGEIEIDSLKYLYTIAYNDFPYIFKSIEPVITSLNFIKNEGSEIITFPNPVLKGQFLNISSKKGIIESVRILDYFGKVIYMSNGHRDEYIINTSDFSTKIYIIEISIKNKLYYNKIIVN